MFYEEANVNARIFRRRKIDKCGVMMGSQCACTSVGGAQLSVTPARSRSLSHTRTHARAQRDVTAARASACIHLPRTLVYSHASGSLHPRKHMFERQTRIRIRTRGDSVHTEKPPVRLTRVSLKRDARPIAGIPQSLNANSPVSKFIRDPVSEEEEEDDDVRGRGSGPG